jgi:hypothetical protein
LFVQRYFGAAILVIVLLRRTVGFVPALKVLSKSLSPIFVIVEIGPRSNIVGYFGFLELEYKPKLHQSQRRTMVFE